MLAVVKYGSRGRNLWALAGWGALLALSGVALVVYNGNFVLDIHPLGNLLTPRRLADVGGRQHLSQKARSASHHARDHAESFLLRSADAESRLSFRPCCGQATACRTLRPYSSICCFWGWSPRCSAMRSGTWRSNGWEPSARATTSTSYRRYRSSAAALILHEKITPLAHRGSRPDSGRSLRGRTRTTAEKNRSATYRTHNAYDNDFFFYPSRLRTGCGPYLPVHTENGPVRKTRTRSGHLGSRAAPRAFRRETGRSHYRRTRRRGRRLRAVFPQLLHVPRPAPELMSKTFSWTKPTGTGDTADACCRIWPQSPQNAGAVAWNGSCSTGTPRRSLFYRSLGAVAMDEWTVFRLGEDDIRRLATHDPNSVSGK